MSERCFVIMPYGEKPDSDGTIVDFDVVYLELIQKALHGYLGLDVLRCDDIEKSGWIHQRMIEQIVSSRIAIVDTSTNNANVFYELGVRHAVKRAVTILVHRAGTPWPFNIAGLSSLKYTTTPAGLTAARKKLRAAVKASLADRDHIDSLVHLAVPDLNFTQGPARRPIHVSKLQFFDYLVSACPERRITLATGDYEDFKVADVWVNSENTNMQMDGFYGRSTSATIRYLGAHRDPETNALTDSIASALSEKLGKATSVDAGTVVVTTAGALEASNNVRWIFHVASVVGQIREGYRPIDGIELCVSAVLREADRDNYAGHPIRSIFMPIFGTGPAGGDFAAHARACFRRALEYLSTRPTTIERVVFLAWTNVALEVSREILGNMDELTEASPS